jgi:hypothetical protein
MEPLLPTHVSVDLSCWVHREGSAKKEIGCRRAFPSVVSTNRSCRFSYHEHAVIHQHHITKSEKFENTQNVAQRVSKQACNKLHNESQKTMGLKVYYSRISLSLPLAFNFIIKKQISSHNNSINSHMPLSEC